MNAKREIINGVTEMVFDGEIKSRVAARPDLPAYLVLEKMEQYERATIDTHFVAMHEPFMLCWDGLETYDYKLYDAHIEHILQFHPNIKLFLYIGTRTSAPYKWYVAHPEECTLLSNGIRMDAPSVASELWKEQSCEAIRKMVKHFDEAPFADNIAGYNFIMGANEWFAYGEENKDPFKEGFADYSIPMQKYYKSWIRRRYNDDVSELQKSWKDKTITFDEVCVPTPDERLNYGHDDHFFSYRTQGNKLVDFYTCFNKAWADMAELWAKTAKEASNREILTGMMNAYTYCGPHVRGFPQVYGHCEMKNLLTSPYIDYFQSPYHYYNRCFGGTHYSQHAIDSVLLHGKLLFDQLDTKTHIKPGDNTNAKTPFETENVLKRDVSYTISKNAHSYWMEIHHGVFQGFGSPDRYEKLHFDDDAIKELILSLKNISDENQSKNSEAVSEVAFFTSKKGCYYMKSENVFQQFYCDAIRQWILPKIGTPFDDYNLEDFELVKRDYKVYIFANSTYVSKKLAIEIRRKLNKNKATAIFFYSPGYIDESGASFKNSERLTGIELSSINSKDYIQIDLRNDLGSDLLKKVSETTYGTDINPDYFNNNQEWLKWPSDKTKYRFSPQIYVSDNDVECLGILRSVNRPGLVRKKVEDSVSIYSSAPLIPASLLRNILTQAGVHIYSKNGSLIYANSKFISITSFHDGVEIIKLIKKGTILNALTKEVVIKNSDTFVFNCKYGETNLFNIV